MRKATKNTDPTPPERVKTGISGLDEVLYGGVIRGNSILVEGKAGTGKSILGLQFLVSGAVQYGERGVLLSFDVEPSKIYRDAANLGWDLKRLEADGKMRMILASAKTALDQLQREKSPLDRIIKDINPSRLVIDSVTLLRDMIPSNNNLRRVIRILLAIAAREGLTLMLITETEDGREAVLERSAVDTILALSAELWGGRDHEVRKLRVVKARGQDFIGGNHTFRIVNRHGISLYPRIRVPDDSDRAGTSPIRDRFGISALDDMLGGGTYRGTTTMLAGSTGTGKSLLGLQFIRTGIGDGKPALIVNMEETPEQIIQNAKVLNFDLAPLIESGMVRLMYANPGEIDLDQHLGIVMEEIRTRGICRVLIDSISNYAVIARNDLHFKDSVVKLVSFLKASNVSSILTSDLPEGTVLRPGQETGAIFVDTILLLRYLQSGSHLNRGLMVLKARGSNHSKDLRLYTIDSGGFQFGEVDPAGAMPPFPSH